MRASRRPTWRARWRKSAARNQHARALKRSFDRFTRKNPYALVVKEFESPVVVQAARRQVRIQQRATASGLFLPPTQRVTDYVRSTMAWANRAHWHARPESAKERRSYDQRLKKLAFPYSKTPEKWKEDVCRALSPSFMSEATLAVLKETQPFSGRQNGWEDPDSHPLSLLHELWNRNKHKTVSLTVPAVGFRSAHIRIPGLFPGDPELATEVIRPFPLRPAEGETELAAIRVHFPHETQASIKGEMKVDADLALGVFFDQGSPAAGEC